MIRKIIHIDQDKCNGCGLCAKACHEGAIGMVDGKATLLRDDYCDGLGDCLPTCPTGAITFVEREALAYDEAAVKANMAARAKAANPANSSAAGGEETLACGCPGSHSRTINRTCEDTGSVQAASGASAALTAPSASPALRQNTSRLSQWPVQIKLAPVNAPYFNGANLLVAADCTAYAYGSFHEDFIRNKVTLIGCPKLDSVDYSEKLTEIIRNNDIKSVTVVRMEVPCCGGIEMAVKKALQDSGKFIPWQVVTISTEGEILEQ
ncbi:MAG TPA: 4Fe-4S binding protein [Candidatus Avanaerovorax faecigallinarum]|nr:4Fe-4S binding protein [Candidatus Avanaerovorax faecigallinarum]